MVLFGSSGARHLTYLFLSLTSLRPLKGKLQRPLKGKGKGKPGKAGKLPVEAV